MSFTLAGMTYRYHRSMEPALRDISATIPTGKVTAVLGLSGSGKTTLLNLLGLLLEEARLERGRICYASPGSAPGSAVNGGPGPRLYEYGRLSAAQRTDLRLHEFGFVLQSCYLLPHLTCAENVAMPLALQGVGRRQREDAVAALIKRVDDVDGHLARDLQRLAGQVAGGQKQRTAVLRAIIHNPRVVFADEPVSNLDFRNTDLVLRLLREWKDGRLNPDDQRERTLVLVSHAIDLAWEVADHFLLLGPDRRLAGGGLLSRADVPGGPDALRRLIGPQPESP